MSFIVQNFQKNTTFLPTSSGNDLQQGLHRRLSSLSIKIQPFSSQKTSWAFQREYAGISIRKWWEWSWSWILSRKPTFAQDLEMNEEETKVNGCHNKGSWRHVFYKVTGSDKVGLPQTFKYNSKSAKFFQG